MDSRDDNASSFDRSPSIDTNDDNLGEAISAERTIPSINRKKTGNKLITIAGTVFIIIIGCVLIMMVNGGKKDVGKHQAAERKKVVQAGNALPPLALPAPAAPAPIPAQTNSARANSGSGDYSDEGTAGGTSSSINGKKKLDWRERKMQGSASSNHRNSSKHSAPTPTPVVTAAPDNKAAKSELGKMLQPTQLTGVTATILKNREFLLTKGNTLDCTLLTAMDSTMAGIVTAVLSQDVYSGLGVKLLSRGTKFVGEYSGGVKQGQARIGTVWSRAETPEGVIINLDSPGTDSLGRAGFEGWVNKHFAERFGAAILLSLIKDTTAYIIAGHQNDGAIIYGSSTVDQGDKLAEKALESSINIPDTIIKNQGDHVQIMIARDLDFSTVYELKVRE